MTDYTQGTVDVTNGSTVVIGNGTDWTLGTPPNARKGDDFVRTGDGVTYKVVSVTNTGPGTDELTLATPYAGVTGAGVPYAIVQNLQAAPGDTTGNRTGSGPPGQAATLDITEGPTLNPNEAPTVTEGGTSTERTMEVSLPRAIQIGWDPVATGAPGTDVQQDVTITPEGDQVIGLTIPRGDKGEQGDTGDVTVVKYNRTQTAHGFAPLDAVYWDGSAYVKAQADNLATIALFVVIEVPTADTFSITQLGLHNIPAHGLTLGPMYWLSQTTPGAITTTEPGSGIAQPVLIAEDADNIWVVPSPALDYLAPLEIDFQLIAGGGHGGFGPAGGGGGAGGVVEVVACEIAPGVYPVVIGAGGADAGAWKVAASNGNDSTFCTETAVGGGAGGNISVFSDGNFDPALTPGHDGGSGGGSGGYHQSGLVTSDGEAGGDPVVGQGNKGGGYIANSNAVPNLAGGGGGQAQRGWNAGNDGTPDAPPTLGGAGSAGDGGDGFECYDGVRRAGGGGGGTDNPGSYTSGAGKDGGAEGGRTFTPLDATANTGGGGGGGGDPTNQAYQGSKGGSGVLVIRYPKVGTDPRRGSGGVETDDAFYWYHVFNTSGDFTVLN